MEKVSARPLKCEEWEALLADALDGVLTAEDSAAFYGHSDSCKGCATTLSETRKGQQWLQFLHGEPAVPGDLVGRILARTSGAAGAGALLAGDGMPSAVPGIQGVQGIQGIQMVPLPPLWKRASVRGFIPALIRRAGEPRLMMTAAMAFFSIALTLNLMGVRVTAVRLSDLKPGVLGTNIRRSYITANARVSRYYDNLRIVYEVESKMREMQRTSEEDQPAPAKPSDKKTDGSAGKTPAPGGKSQSPRHSGSRAYLSGHTELASLDHAAKAIEPTPEIRNKKISERDSIENRRLGRSDSDERTWA